MQNEPKRKKMIIVASCIECDRAGSCFLVKSAFRTPVTAEKLKPLETIHPDCLLQDADDLVSRQAVIDWLKTELTIQTQEAIRRLIIIINKLPSAGGG